MADLFMRPDITRINARIAKLVEKRSDELMRTGNAALFDGMPGWNPRLGAWVWESPTRKETT